MTKQITKWTGFSFECWCKVYSKFQHIKDPSSLSDDTEHNNNVNNSAGVDYFVLLSLDSFEWENDDTVVNTQPKSVHHTNQKHKKIFIKSS